MLIMKDPKRVAAGKQSWAARRITKAEREKWAYENLLRALDDKPPIPLDEWLKMKSPA